jgi:hypothetical protein
MLGWGRRRRRVGAGVAAGDNSRGGVAAAEGGAVVLVAGSRWSNADGHARWMWGGLVASWDRNEESGCGEANDFRNGGIVGRGVRRREKSGEAATGEPATGGARQGTCEPASVASGGARARRS